MNGLLLTDPGCGQFGGANFQVMLTQQRMFSLQDECTEVVVKSNDEVGPAASPKCECLSLSKATTNSDAKPLLADLELQCDSALDQCRMCSLHRKVQQICRQLAGPVIHIELYRWTSYLSECECDDPPWSMANSDCSPP